MFLRKKKKIKNVIGGIEKARPVTGRGAPGARNGSKRRRGDGTEGRVRERTDWTGRWTGER